MLLHMCGPVGKDIVEDVGRGEGGLAPGHQRYVHKIPNLFCATAVGYIISYVQRWNTSHCPQDCETHQNLRAETWSVDTAVLERVYGPVKTLHTS